MTIWLKIIGRTREDEESGLLMGFGDHCLTRDCGQQDAASELPVLHRDTMQGFQCRVDCCVLCSRWMGRSAVLRCSGSRTTYPTPLPSSTHPQPKTSRELGRFWSWDSQHWHLIHVVSSLFGWKWKKTPVVRSSKRISRKKCGTQIFWVKWARGETLEIGTNLDSGSILTTIIYSHILQLWSKEYNEGVKIDQLHGTVYGRAEGGQFSGLGSCWLHSAACPQFQPLNGFIKAPSLCIAASFILFWSVITCTMRVYHDISRCDHCRCQHCYICNKCLNCFQYRQKCIQ